MREAAERRMRGPRQANPARRAHPSGSGSLVPNLGLDLDLTKGSGYYWRWRR
jgi:hypothetical protein